MSRQGLVVDGHECGCGCGCGYPRKNESASGYDHVLHANEDQARMGCGRRYESASANESRMRARVAWSESGNGYDHVHR